MFYFGANVVAQITLESFICELTQCGIECHSQTTLPRPHEDALGSSYVDFDLGSLELVVVPLELDLLLGLLAVVGAVVEGVHGPLAIVLLADDPSGFRPLLLCVAREVSLIGPWL